MIRILDIALKDLLQLSRDFKTFMFLLIMPLAFTFLFGFAFGGFGGENSDNRLPVGWLSQDSSPISKKLHGLLSASEVVRLVEYSQTDRAELEKLVADKKIAAALIIPERYGRTLLNGRRPKMIFIGDTSSTAGMSIQSEVLSKAVRLENAVRTARVFEEVAGNEQPFDYIMDESLSRWDNPPIAVSEIASGILKSDNTAMAHTSPGMMLQFAIAGLLTAAQIIVSERKAGALQRLLTTATERVHILLGHYLAIFTLIFSQFFILILFGQIVLKVDYLRDPVSTFLVAFTAATCISALGLLIGTLARNEDQAVVFSLIPMFVFAGLGGAWVPLEATGTVFQTVGHLSPIAWAMDGFKNISIRGQGLTSVLIPSLALLTYGAVFFAIANWRFRKESI